MKKLLVKILHIILNIIFYKLERKYPSEFDGYKYYKTKIRIIHPFGFLLFIIFILYGGISYIKNDLKDEFCTF